MVQADVRQLLLDAPFELEDEQVNVILEAQVGDRRRIDVEVGFTVIEVKKDLRVGNIAAEAVDQLAGYVATRTEMFGQRYVGVLTDGARWRLYHLVDGIELAEVSAIVISGAGDLERLVGWLEGVLATTSRIVPTPEEIDRRIGANSSAHALERATLVALFEKSADNPSVALKRQLWARLLTTALGTGFSDDDELFIEHTLLVTSAEIIAHAVIGFELTDINPAQLVTGQLFASRGVLGVVEADFFDWVIEVEGGSQFIRSLARRLSRFAWNDVEHDVMKTLYESIIDAEQRKQLGEYYTPDWLAHQIVEATVDNPATDRILDPACGSGTFLFHAIRRVLAAMDEAGENYETQMQAITSRVIGVDLHPVAVTLARVTYLLALGSERLIHPDRPEITVPVYLGESLLTGQRDGLLGAEGLRIATSDGNQLFADELVFPAALVEDGNRFDQLVSELADKASRRSDKRIPSLTPEFRRHAVPTEHQEQVTKTFGLMCRLHDQGRNHIWGYYIRNLARPMWLSSPGHRVDALVGNPPWLSYRFMTDEMQESFQQLSAARGLWHGATVATHQDLSGLFFVRSAELYLRPGGRIGFVMPQSALSRRQHKGLRTGHYPDPEAPTDVRFDTPWDLHKVKPSFFPVPPCVLFATKEYGNASPLPPKADAWSGRLRASNVSWTEAAQHITRTTQDSAPATDIYRSPYRERFAQGATMLPRRLICVEEAPAGPLGAGPGRITVRSRQSANEKKPWKELTPLEGTIETEFVRPMYLGENTLSYRLLDPILAVTPYDGTALLEGNDERIDHYPGFAAWWRQAEGLWDEHGRGKMTLLERLDYRRLLATQFPTASHRVVYTKSGQYLAAARLNDSRVILDHKLYWATARTAEEALYLVAILNSAITTLSVRPLQSRGEHNPRDFDKYVWQLPIPEYDAEDSVHQELAVLAGAAEELVASLSLDLTKSFQTSRKRVRAALAGSEIGNRIEQLVTELLGSQQTDA